MIEYVKGELIDVTPAYAVVETHGVGYGMNISLNTFSAIQGKKEARLWAYEAIREDAYVLFGFATKQERDMFLLLITVSGVGANTARMILSEMTVAEICNVISTGNERILKSVKIAVTERFHRMREGQRGRGRWWRAPHTASRAYRDSAAAHRGRSPRPGRA